MIATVWKNLHSIDFPIAKVAEILIRHHFLSRSLSLDYMTFRLWIGLWSSSLCLVIVATDASVIVRYFTRFTEESFAALIGIIFIVEALKKLFCG